MPEVMPAGAQCEERAGMARFVDATDELAGTLSAPTSEVSGLWGSGRRGSVGRNRGAGARGAGKCGRPSGPRTERERSRPAVPVELEDGGRNRATRGGLWFEES